MYTATCDVYLVSMMYCIPHRTLLTRLNKYWHIWCTSWEMPSARVYLHFQSSNWRKPLIHFWKSVSCKPCKHVAIFLSLDWYAQWIMLHHLVTNSSLESSLNFRCGSQYQYHCFKPWQCFRLLFENEQAQCPFYKLIRISVLLWEDTTRCIY